MSYLYANKPSMYSSSFLDFTDVNDEPKLIDNLYSMLYPDIPKVKKTVSEPKTKSYVCNSNMTVSNALQTIQRILILIGFSCCLICCAISSAHLYNLYLSKIDTVHIFNNAKVLNIIPYIAIYCVINFVLECIIHIKTTKTYLSHLIWILGMLRITHK